MAVFRCTVCDTEYDEEKEGANWEELKDNWACHVCESGKTLWRKIEEEVSEAVPEGPKSSDVAATLEDLKRKFDDFEIHMSDIHQMAETGKSVIEPMRTRKPVLSWDQILILGAQLATLPLNPEEEVSSRTVIGPAAAQPLVMETPIYVSHMSFGALSLEAKVALATGSAAVKTAMCSGEGGIVPQSLEKAHKYIFEYVPNRYSVTEDNLKKVDAIEIKIGQSAKPGMGGHLPGDKVTAEIAEIRGFQEGFDIISPSHFADILNREDLKNKVDWLRDASEGKPVGIKVAAGHIEADLDTALFAGPDFITIDGRPGATGASPKLVKAATSLPAIFALYRARKFMQEKGVRNVSLVITGGLRVSPDFAKALALGADAVAIASAALMAIGCQQYKVCHTGQCPMGITTQDPELRARLNIEVAAKGLENFLRTTTEELKNFARLTGKNDVHALDVTDLCTTNSEISNYTDIPHV